MLTEDQKRTLQEWARSRLLPARQVERARVVLLAAGGKQDLEIAAEVGISNQKAARWRKRFLQLGLAGLEKDAPRPGRRPTSTPATVQEVVRKTTQQKPANATQWSTRSMAVPAGVSEKSVRRIWHKHGLKPHLSRTFKVSNDPELLPSWKLSSASTSTRRSMPSYFVPTRRARSKRWTEHNPDCRSRRAAVER